MDTSEQYIEMCNCPEIQGKKVVIRDKDNFVYIEIKKRAYYIWLPRQDHIQDMMGCIPGNHLSLMNKFCKFDYYHSLEQKWLAFYMSETHKKIWNGKKWIK